MDPLELSQALIRCPSVTPTDAGALDVLAGALEGLGFTCHRLMFSEPGAEDVDNLYARIGEAAPNFCFAGHTDVVPVDGQPWDTDPFAVTRANGRLYGRGTSDMKSFLAVALALAPAIKARKMPCVGGAMSTWPRSNLASASRGRIHSPATNSGSPGSTRGFAEESTQAA